MTAVVLVALLGGLAAAGAGAHTWLARLSRRRVAGTQQRAREAAWRRALPSLPVDLGPVLTPEAVRGLHDEARAITADAARGAR